MQKENANQKQKKQGKKEADKKGVRKSHQRGCKYTRETDTIQECPTRTKKAIEKEERAKIEKVYQTILQEGGTSSQTFWKTKRKILRANITYHPPLAQRTYYKIIQRQRKKRQMLK